MNKTNMVQSIHEAMRRAIPHDGPAPVTQAQIAWVLEEYGNVAAAELLAGFEVPVPRLGRLVAVGRRQRTGRNMRTGERLTISARLAVAFRPNRNLKDALAG